MEMKRRKERLGVRVLGGWSRGRGWDLHGEEEKNGDKILEGGVNKSIFHLPGFTYPGQVSDCHS